MNLPIAFKIVMLRYKVSISSLAKKRHMSCRGAGKAMSSKCIKPETIKSYCKSIGCTIVELMKEVEDIDEIEAKRAKQTKIGE